MTARRLLVTGGLGFIGAHFISRWLDSNPNDSVVNLDAETYAADASRLAALRGERCQLVSGSICDEPTVEEAVVGADVIVNFAAESHVDRSIDDASEFVRTNVQGTQTLLDAARRHDVERFHQVSTDEVFGSLPLQGDDAFTEETPFAPRSPYAATKAAADHLVGAYATTYGMRVTTSHGSNTYGPYQFPEKFLPRMILRAMNSEPLPVYGNGLNVRDWMHVYDHADGIARIIKDGKPGRRYCVGGDDEHQNLQVAHKVIKAVGNDGSRVEFVKDRPGHDLRYAMRIDRMRAELNWSPTVPFGTGLRQTVAWYQENEEWWKPRRAAAERYYMNPQMSSAKTSKAQTAVARSLR